MNSSPDNENQNRSKVCGNCFKRLPNVAQFCPFCGFEADIPTSNICPNCHKPVQKNTVYCQFCGINTKNFRFGEYPPQVSEQNLTGDFQQIPAHPVQLYRKPKKPGIFKLPLFYLIFCIFGIELALEFFVVLLYALISTSPEIPLEITLILSNIIRFLQVFVIYFIISRKSNFKNFRPFQSKSNLESNSNTIRNPVRYSIKTTLLTIPLIISLVYLANTLAIILIDYLKSLFNVSSNYFSPYSEFGQSDIVIIIFTITAIFIAPVLEEILFRGYLHHSFVKAGLSDWSQYFLQAFLFAFLHLFPDIIGNGSIDFILLHMFSTATLAIGATWLRKKYDSVTYSILLHAAWNSLSVILSYLSQIFPSEADLLLIEAILLVCFIIISAISFIFLKLTKEWKLSIPVAIKNFRNDSDNLLYRIVILSVCLAIISSLLQFLPFLPFFSSISLDEFQLFFYMISISVISTIFLFVWPNYLYDTTLDEVKKEKQKS
ncbi:MAG: CPBP family glutamic-type intramembrane protease [Candidatus Hodarchaeales archaeon]